MIRCPSDPKCDPNPLWSYKNKKRGFRCLWGHDQGFPSPHKSLRSPSAEEWTSLSSANCASPATLPLLAAIRAGDSHPVLPLFADLHEHCAHDTCTRHETMAFTFKYSDLATPHSLAEPANVLDRDARVSASVVDNNGPCNVNIPEADGMPSLKTYKQVDGRIGTCGG